MIVVYKKIYAQYVCLLFWDKREISLSTANTHTHTYIVCRLIFWIETVSLCVCALCAQQQLYVLASREHKQQELKQPKHHRRSYTYDTFCTLPFVCWLRSIFLLTAVFRWKKHFVVKSRGGFRSCSAVSRRRFSEKKSAKWIGHLYYYQTCHSTSVHSVEVSSHRFITFLRRVSRGGNHKHIRDRSPT